MGLVIVLYILKLKWDRLLIKTYKMNYLQIKYSLISNEVMTYAYEIMGSDDSFKRKKGSRSH